MNPKKFNGLFNAVSEKRYKHFLSTSADREFVWMIDCGNDELFSPVFEDEPYFFVWSEKEFAEHMLKAMVENVFPDLKGMIVPIEVHEFCDILKMQEIKFMVFPVFTDHKSIDGWIVSSSELLENLLYELSLVE